MSLTWFIKICSMRQHRHEILLVYSVSNLGRYQHLSLTEEGSSSLRLPLISVDSKVAFVPINENTYLLTNIMEQTFLDGATPDGSTTLRTALSLDDLWQVIQNPVMDAWYDNTCSADMARR
ncbi:hypothetical protein AHF37_11482 [Paragonimus kellicotti]|nr:hypothetical protein AHF37_11482 [Paragonimus kellicotti]